MTHADALEHILTAENAALTQHDPERAVALVERKLAATQALAGEVVPPEQLERLRALAQANKQLLERAISVQTQIIDMVVRAVQGTPQHTRYGAAGRAVRDENAVALARQA